MVVSVGNVTGILDNGFCGFFAGFIGAPLGDDSPEEEGADEESDSCGSDHCSSFSIHDFSYLVETADVRDRGE